MQNYAPLLITAGIILLLVLAIAALVLWIRRKVRRFSRQIFGTDSIGEGISRQQDLLAETPKSVSSMTRLCLPQIEADFPGFNYPVFRQKAENMLRCILLSIDAGRVRGLENASTELLRQVETRIEDNRRQGREEHYGNIVIHQTEISRYSKEAGRCIVRLQSAVGYRYYALQNGQATAGDRERDTQTKYNMELHYIQDPSKAQEGSGVGLTCPSCGAPVTNLGAKFCEYCGLGVKEIEDRVWRINRYEEV